MQAIDRAKNPSGGMGLDEYVRHCAGLGLVVRVYRWRCPSCGTEAAKAQAVNRALMLDLELVAHLDRLIPAMHRPMCCGAPMIAEQPVTRDGGIGLVVRA